jgi:hypothetical protein
MRHGNDYGRPEPQRPSRGQLWLEKELSINIVLGDIEKYHEGRSM